MQTRSRWGGHCECQPQSRWGRGSAFDLEESSFGDVVGVTCGSTAPAETRDSGRCSADGRTGRQTQRQVEQVR